MIWWKGTHSDNKNTVTPERTHLSDDTIMGLRRLKEHVHHQNYVQRKKEEAERLKLEQTEKERIEQEKAHTKAIQMAESSKTSLDTKEKLLTQDEKKAEEEFMLAQRILSEASTRLTEAIEKIDMIGVKLAKEMLDSTQRSYETASTHREEIKKV